MVSDQKRRHADECEKMIRLLFVAAVQAPASCQPGHGSLDHPAVSTEPSGRLDALARNAVADTSFPKPFPQVVVVVAFVGV